MKRLLAIAFATGVSAPAPPVDARFTPYEEEAA